MADKVYLACVTTDMSAVPNSTKGRCAECDAEIWVSISGQRFADSVDLIIFICVGCIKKINEDGKTEFESVPGGIKEALDYLRKAGNASNN